MREPEKPDPNLITLSPETLLAILFAAIFIPLIVTGFVSH